MRVPAFLAGCLLAAVMASPAQAGSYQVRACHSDGVNASWHAATSNQLMAAYFECPGGVATGGRLTEGMIARHSGGPEHAPAWSEALVYFDAPPGTAVTGVTGEARMTGEAGWDAGVRDQGNGTWLWCGPACSSSYGGWYGFNAAGFATSRVGALTICANGNGCRRDGNYGFIGLRNVTVTVADDSPPSVSIAPRGLGAPGWHRGTKPLVVEASDNVGIARVDAHAAGRHIGSDVHACDDRRPIPCPDSGGTVHTPTTALSDGRHTFTVHAVDGAGNRSQATRPVLIDNTAPVAVSDLRVTGGDGWRSSETVSLTWNSADERGLAPLVGGEYEICPVGGTTGCHRESRNARLDGSDLRLPGPGLWTIGVWLRDAAGNQDPRVAQRVSVGYDPTPPDIALAESSPDDPARLLFRASDAVSGLARGEVELRRRGAETWTPIHAEVTEKGVVALVDDEALPSGIYEVRGRVFDRAGNERSTDRRLNGEVAILRLPLRLNTTLKAGKRRGARLRARTTVAFGRRLTLTGRLTAPGKNALSGREVEVLEQLMLPGAQWARVGSLRTGRTGRFSYRVPRGPSRVLRFRFPGTPTIRARSKDVEVRVRAAARMRSSRRSVVNGEEVSFSGWLAGRPLPATGKLLQLQAYSRRRWLTFATPRAHPRTGRWRYRYRFAATRGRVRYRFRVRVPREASYPFHAGTSKTVRVLVRGL